MSSPPFDPGLGSGGAGVAARESWLEEVHVRAAGVFA
jgi:hypothetical protein